jgi:hypothetical protein
MKQITQKEFNNFKYANDGILYLPSADYSLIKVFGDRCSFDERCSFSNGCSFGGECSFGEGCSFGKWCSFGKGCKYRDFTFKEVFCLYGIYKFSIIIYSNQDKYILSVGCDDFNSIDEAIKRAKELNCYCEKTEKIVRILLEARKEEK